MSGELTLRELPDGRRLMFRKVDSSNLREISLDYKGNLIIIFHNNRIYQYDNVGIKAYDGLRNSKSPGSYFRVYIKPVFKNYKEIKNEKV